MDFHRWPLINRNFAKACTCALQRLTQFDSGMQLFGVRPVATLALRDDEIPKSRRNPSVQRLIKMLSFI